MLTLFDDVLDFQGHLWWLIDHNPYKHTIAILYRLLCKIRICFQYNSAITADISYKQ